MRAQQIKIEVTERGFIDVPKTTPVIQAFRQAGYEVAIDDFGTGYSNLLGSFYPFRNGFEPQALRHLDNMLGDKMAGAVGG